MPASLMHRAMVLMISMTAFADDVFMYVGVDVLMSYWTIQKMDQCLGFVNTIFDLFLP